MPPGSDPYLMPLQWELGSDTDRLADAGVTQWSNLMHSPIRTHPLLDDEAALDELAEKLFDRFLKIMDRRAQSVGGGV